MGMRLGADLPVGVVTMLFSDIEGSTRLLTELGDLYGGVLFEHHRLLRDIWSECGGVEVNTEGDAFFVAFVDARAAVRAAAAAQRVLSGHDWGHGVKLRVRMGLHTGRPKLRDGDYWGLDVHYAARLASAASGGQVLVSESTADLVDAELEDLGEHGLKDFPVPRRVFHLVVDGLSSAEFPPPRMLRAGRTNLPAQLTSFVGRERELDQVCSLLEESKLVTLVGPGGVGKTRLSVAAGARLLDGSGDGVWLVELAGFNDGGLVAREASRALGVAEQRGKSVIESLVEGARNRRLLLILDNCEHVIEAAAEVAAALLAGCRDVTILATSREALAIPGERVFRVPSLSLPKGKDLSSSEAVRLLVERARERGATFVLDESNVEAVIGVVRRLDGIPLALELAAARLNSLAVGDLLVRLDRSLKLLTGGARTGPRRQQTLEALIDWSYDLLGDRDRELLESLSVFAGGFDLDAAEALHSSDQVDELDVIDVLGSLVDKSLVQVDDIGERLRYRLLASVREYAAEKLSASGETRRSRIRAAHRDYYLALAETAMEFPEPDREVWIDRLELEHDNIRAALAFSLEDPDPEPGLRLASAVSVPRYYRGRGRESAESLLQHLGRPEAAPATLVRARALAAATRPVNAAIGDQRLAAELAQEAVAIAHAAKDVRLEARALGELSWPQFVLGRADEAVESAQRAVDLARQLGDAQLLGFTLSRLAWAQRSAGHEFRETLAEAADVARQNGNRRTLATVVQNLGLEALADGDVATARIHLKEAQRLAREVQDFPLTLGSIVNLGLAEYIDHDPNSASTSFKDALRIGRDRYLSIIPYGLNGLALVAEEAEPERAAWLHGAVDSFLADTGGYMDQPEGRLRQESCQRLRVRLGDAIFENQFGAGRSSPTEAAIRAALEE